MHSIYNLSDLSVTYPGVRMCSKRAATTRQAARYRPLAASAILSVAHLLSMYHLLPFCSYTLNSSSNHIVFFIYFSLIPYASIYDFTSIFFESRNDLGGWEYTEHHNIHSHDIIFLLILSEKNSGAPETSSNTLYQFLKRSANMWAM